MPAKKLIINSDNSPTETTPLFRENSLSSQHNLLPLINSDISQILNTDSHAKHGKVWTIAGQTFRIVEDSANGYWLYTVICNSSAWQGLWGFGFVGGGLVVGIVKEGVFRKISPAVYEKSVVITETIAIASVVVSYLQYLLANDTAGSVAGLAALSSLTSLNLFYEFYLKGKLATNPEFNSRPVQYFIKSLQIGYYGLLGASFAYYGQQLAYNLFDPPSNLVDWTTQLATGFAYAAINVMKPKPFQTTQSDIANVSNSLSSTLLINSHRFLWLLFNTASYSVDASYIVLNILLNSFAAYEIEQGNDNSVTDLQFSSSLVMATGIFIASSIYYGKEYWDELNQTEALLPITNDDNSADHLVASATSDNSEDNLFSAAVSSCVENNLTDRDPSIPAEDTQDSPPSSIPASSVEDTALNDSLHTAEDYIDWDEILEASAKEPDYPKLNESKDPNDSILSLFFPKARINPYDTNQSQPPRIFVDAFASISKSGLCFK